MAGGPQVIPLIATQTAGATATFDVSNLVNFWIMAPGLAGAETVTVGVAATLGGAVSPVFGYLKATATDTAPLIAALAANLFPGGCFISVTKSATAASVPVFLVPCRPSF